MRAGRDDEFDALLRALEPRLSSVAMALTGHVDDAQDLLQVVALKLWRSWPAVRDAASPQAFAARVAVNAHATARRRFWHRERPTDAVPDAATVLASPVETAAGLDAVLQGLPARQRAALVLRYVCDLGDAEIAAALGCSPSTVRSQTSRALAHLRAAAGAAVVRSEP